jgi:hypothetical protein
MLLELIGAAKTAKEVVVKAAEALEYMQKLGMSESDKDRPNPVSDVARILIQGVFYNIVYSPIFSWVELQRLSKNNLGHVDVVDLREKTSGDKRWVSGTVTCDGMFLAGSLLNIGWWEKRGANRHVAPVNWGDIKGVQSWLHHGFLQWAPSWDVNQWEAQTAAPFLFGQIGREDEADSIPVIIADPKKASDCREALTDLSRGGGRLVSHASVKGKLYSLHDLKKYRGDAQAKGFIDDLIARGAIRDHCLVVDQDHSDKEQHRDRIDLLTRKACEEPYSGYMWKAVCPNEHKKDLDLLPYTYFVWEHTNFADKDAINYNMDSLNHKIQYIAEHRLGGRASDGVTLLQQMMPEDRLRGEPGASYERPAITMDEFMKLFAQDHHPSHKKS